MKTVKVKVEPKYELEDRLNIVKINSQGLHSVVRHTLLSSRLFGLLPLSGLLHPSSSNLRFSLWTPYVLIYFISVFGQIFMSFLNIYHFILNCCSLIHVTNMLFYTNGLIATLMLIKIGMAWPRVLRKVESIEKELPPLTRNLSKPCTLLTVFILLTALMEHLLSILYGLRIAHICDPDNFWETYFSQSMPWVFSFITYTHWKGIVTEIFNVQATFLWSFNDLLIMTCSIYLTEHFLIHKKYLKQNILNEIYYLDDFRIQYLNIVSLVRLINKQIGIYIISSFACNLYWICWQMFNSLNKNNTGHIMACNKPHNQSLYSSEHTAYFAFSFTFLLIRTLLVSLLAARIRSASLAPMHLLFGIPSSNFTGEIQRYIDQVKYTKVALSGLDFFFVTRKMILSLFGTIVTYELVLLQFNVTSYDPSGTNSCYDNNSST